CAIHLATERHGRIVPLVALNSCLHPNDAPGVDVGFQCRDGRRVVGKEIIEKRVVPVKNDDPILAEVEASQLCGRKLSISVSGTRDGILKDRKAPWIMRLE